MREFSASDGRALSYLIDGDGPVIVFLPGGPGFDPGSYYAPAQLPSWTRVVLCPRGTGASDAPEDPSGYRLDGYVADVEELRRHLGQERMVLYGHSHGAMVALAYAQAYSDRVERLVLVAVPTNIGLTRYVDAAVKRFLRLVADGQARLDAAADASATADNAADDATRRAALRTIMSRYVAELNEATVSYLDRLCSSPMNFDAAQPMYKEVAGGRDLLPGAAAVNAPTLVIAGELDVTVPAEHVKQAASALSNARYLEFAEVGHFPEAEATQAWADAVMKFLDSR
jgi:proline iminopeptidase